MKGLTVGGKAAFHAEDIDFLQIWRKVLESYPIFFRRQDHFGPKAAGFVQDAPQVPGRKDVMIGKILKSH